MRELKNVIKCSCGRTICDLCQKERACKVMRNHKNGNTLNVCESCYKELWGELDE